MDLEWEKEEPHDNVIAGTVGAFLGSLIGVACIVLVSKLGYVAAISGVVMAVCAIKGYALLGGRFSKRGAVISGILIIVMTYIAHKIDFSLAVMEVASEDVSFFRVYQSAGLLLEDKEISRLYWGELALLYLFTLVGGIPVLISSLREPAKQRSTSPETAAVDEPPPIQGEFYALSRDWMTPLRRSVVLPMLVIVFGLVGGLLASMCFRETRLMTALTFGGFPGVVYMLCAALPTMQLCNGFHILYVRAGGELWRADLQRLWLIPDWRKLSEGRRDSGLHVFQGHAADERAHLRRFYRRGVYALRGPSRAPIVQWLSHPVCPGRGRAVAGGFAAAVAHRGLEKALREQAGRCQVGYSVRDQLPAGRRSPQL